MHNRRAGAVVAGLLTLHACLLAWSSLRNSVTFDEYAHLPAGLSYWQYGSFDVYDYTPPLPRLLGSWPALLAGAHVPPVGPYLEMDPAERHWRYATEFMHENRARYHLFFVLGRLGLIPVSCLGALVVYWWARELYGAAAGLLSCALYVLCPNLLAHASIVGTDTATVVSMLLALWAWWRFCRAPRWRWWALATAGVSAALLCKFTAVLLCAAMLLIAWYLTPRDRRAWKRIAAGYAGAAVAALILINALYLFEGTGRRLDAFHFYSNRIQHVQAAAPALRLPLPAPMIEGVDRLKSEMETGLPGYLLGDAYVGSRWYYYPVVLLCKLPLATLLLLGWTLATLAGVLPTRRDVSATERAIVATVLLYLLSSMFLGRVNLGVRYVMPILPLLFVLAGRLWPPDEAQHAMRARIAVIALAFGVAAESLCAAPLFLPFLNLAWGGPRHGYQIVNDSNFDWGQGLLDLKRWMAANRVRRIQLCYFGRVEPSVYGIDYVPITQSSDERYVAVSAYFLSGMAHRLHTREGVSSFVRLEWFRELQAKKPAAIVGHSIYIFERSDFDAAAREHAVLDKL